jgi:hypothetical protein
VSVRDVSLGLNILIYVLMLSAIPIVTPVVSYWLMILNSSIILLKTVKYCSSILTVFKIGSMKMTGNYVYIFTIKTNCIYLACKFDCILISR